MRKLRARKCKLRGYGVDVNDGLIDEDPAWDTCIVYQIASWSPDFSVSDPASC